MFRTAILTSAILVLGSGAFAKCGGDFSSFVAGLKKEAVQRGASKAEADRFFASVKRDKKVISQDRSQSVFRQNFSQFAGRVVSQNRMQVGASKWKQYRGTFDRAERDYGIPAPVLLAFWAMETDFGANQGGFNTLNALATLAHDCRRPDLFRPQIFAALELWKQGTFDPASSKGAWAGEIGMVQMLPEDVLTKGVDGDGDGRVDLVRSAPDAILTAAKVLQGHGWRKGQPWMIEVTVPSKMNWAQSGLGKPQKTSQWASKGIKARNGNLPGNLPASLLLPEGRKGPAFLVYDNFDVYFDWNKSLVNVTSAAYFATRLGGAARFNAGTPDAPLSGDQMVALQKKLKRRGHDVGKVDGILGAKTRAAVQAEQARLKLPADAWPTRDLLGRL
ncbi:MAG: lytic murein transglycosylase [Pseudomonadota bacterium]